MTAAIDTGLLKLVRDARPHLIPIGKHSDPLAASEPDDRVELDDSIARLRMELGKQFEGAWAEGREMSLGEAQALASS